MHTAAMIQGAGRAIDAGSADHELTAGRVELGRRGLDADQAELLQRPLGQLERAGVVV